jgi:NYN domain
MEPKTEKMALFIDGANLYATAKSLGFDIDYKRLLSEFQSRGYLLRAFYYTAVIEDQEYSSIRPLIDWLDYNGYSVVTKATKEFVDQTGRRKVKGNMNTLQEICWRDGTRHDRESGASRNLLARWNTPRPRLGRKLSSTRTSIFST